MQHFRRATSPAIAPYVTTRRALDGGHQKATHTDVSRPATSHAASSEDRWKTALALPFSVLAAREPRKQLLARPRLWHRESPACPLRALPARGSHALLRMGPTRYMALGCEGVVQLFKPTWGRAAKPPILRGSLWKPFVKSSEGH